MNYRITRCQPFGAVIYNTDGPSSVADFSAEQLQDWVAEHRLVVFRGYSRLPKQELALFAQRLGKPLQWPFGAINELKVKADAENYIFTDHAVPMHWDGAFAGRIPHIILFQCIIAPKPEDRGGTTFADTRRIIEHAAPETLRKWKDITVTYRTKKVVHYGGEITQPLLAAHEVTGVPVLRYAEPVEDLNPVSLEVSGLQDMGQDDFVSEMRAQLYAPDHLYTHTWEASDIVLADNHSLLHGREAFANPNERYIQRINILHRPPKSGMARTVQNSLTIRRKEFFVAELPIFLIPLLLGAGNLRVFTGLNLYAGLLAVILLFNLGDMINCYADYRLDAIYKSHLSNAVYELGKRNVRLQILISGLLALALTVFVSLCGNYPWLIPVTLAGAVVGMLYSVGPYRFKSAGPLQLFCLWGIIFFGPMLYTGVVTSGAFPETSQLLLFAAYGFHQMGIILLNTAEDYTEDREAGLRTIIVWLGLHRALRFAVWLVFLSGLGLQAALAAIFHRAGAPWYLYGSIGVFTFGWIRILREYRSIQRRMTGLDVPEALTLIRKNGMKVPEWLKTGAYTSLVPVAAFFLYRLFF